MAESNFYDVAFLLGVEYMQTKIIKNGRSDLLVPRKSTPFLRKLSKILEYLSTKTHIGELCNTFNLPPALLEMLCNKKKGGGYCALCDRHFPKIKAHLKLKHELSDKNSAAFLESLKLPFSFEMPIDFKNIESSDRIKIRRGRIGNFTKFIAESTVIAMRGFYVVKSDKNVNKNKKECVMCEECGKLLSMKAWSLHVRTHVKFELVDCLGCGNTIKQKLFAKHVKECFPKLPE